MNVKETRIYADFFLLQKVVIVGFNYDLIHFLTLGAYPFTRVLVNMFRLFRQPLDQASLTL